MLKFLKRDYSIAAPVDGDVIDLSEVPDQIFSNKVAGEGVAIIPSSNIFTAPANGVINLIFNTNHAFSISLNNGVNILVHIGIDTVDLNGFGFERLVEEGTPVKVGTPIIKVDEKLLKEKKYCFITPIIITNPEKLYDIQFNISSSVKSTSDKIISYKLQ